MISNSFLIYNEVLKTFPLLIKFISFSFWELKSVASKTLKFRLFEYCLNIFHAGNNYFGFGVSDYYVRLSI